MKLDMPELKNVVLGNDIKNCLHCRLAKAKRLPFDQECTRATRILEKVHSDMLGPINPCGFRTAHKYIITFKDDYSRYAEAYTMFDKTQVDIALRKYLQKLRMLLSFDYKPVEHLINRNEGRQVSCKNGKLHTDNGTEFKTTTMKKLLQEEGIILDPCHPHTSQHNVVAGRYNLDLEKKVTAQLSSAGMPMGFWPICLDYATYIQNRTASKSLGGLSPFEKLTGKKPKRLNFRRFGCQAVVIKSKQTKT